MHIVLAEVGLNVADKTWSVEDWGVLVLLNDDDDSINGSINCAGIIVQVLTIQFSTLTIACVSWGVKENRMRYSRIPGQYYNTIGVRIRNIILRVE